ncbi:MAG: hypothetical protein AB4290_26365 [Spirulina sp.]
MQIFTLQPWCASLGLIALLFLPSCNFDSQATQLKSSPTDSITIGNESDRIPIAPKVILSPNGVISNPLIFLPLLLAMGIFLVLLQI